MNLYTPGPGMGPAMHIRRVRALQKLEKAGLITFRSYSKGNGYALTTAAGEERQVGAPEMAAYVAGMLDFYCSMRLGVDELVGERALDALDDKYLEQLTDCLSAVLPGEAPS